MPAPSLAGLHRGAERLIGRYHQALAHVLAERPAVKAASWNIFGTFAVKAAQKPRKETWKQLQQRFLEQSEQFFDEAAALGLQFAGEILQADIPDDVVDRVDAALGERKRSNEEFVQKNLFADLEDGRYDASSENAQSKIQDGETDEQHQERLDGALDARLGMYADALWPVTQETFAAPVMAVAEVLMIWSLDPAADNCVDCTVIAANNPYTDPDADIEGGNPLPTYPGDGDTACLTRCRCTLEFEETSWANYVKKNGLEG